MATMTDAQVVAARLVIAARIETVAGLARRMGVGKDALYLAVKGRHFSHLPHATKPVPAGQFQRKLITSRGVTLGVSEWAQRMGVTRVTIQRWLKSDQHARLC